MAVFVLDRRKKPLMPCAERRARLLLARGRARVHRVVPLTIRLVDRLQEDSTLQPLRLKMDPGSQTTGMALVREPDTTDTTREDTIRALTVLMLLEIQHRGPSIHEALTQRRAFRRRRRGNLWHRPARFDNRTRPEGWLAPSLQTLVVTLRNHFDNIITFIERPLTNAVGEGINRLLKIVKNRASGFHGLEPFADLIFLTIGDLDIPAHIPSDLRTL